MPLINYLWVGKPRYNTTGQDIMGPVLMAQKIENTENRICFWCPKEYENEYKNIFKPYKNIDVRNYEDYFDQNENDKEIADVAKIYDEAKSIGKVQPFITTKDMLAFMIASRVGGYVLDTNIIPTDDKVNFPKPGKFTCPLVEKSRYIKVHEAWAKAAKENDEVAKDLFTEYLKAWEKLQNNFSDVQNKYDSPKYYDSCGALITSFLRNNSQYLNTWSTEHSKGDISTEVTDLNLTKLYYNTHKFKNRKKQPKDFAFDTLFMCAQWEKHHDVFRFMVEEAKADITGKDKYDDSILDCLYELRVDVRDKDGLNKLVDILVKSDNPYLEQLLEISKKNTIQVILNESIEKPDFDFFERIVKTANADISGLDDDEYSILDNILAIYVSEPENLNRFLDILISSNNKYLNSIVEASNKNGQLTCLHLYIGMATEGELDKDIISKFINLGVSIDIEANMKDTFGAETPAWTNQIKNIEKVTVLDILKAKKESGDKSTEVYIAMVEEIKLNSKKHLDSIKDEIPANKSTININDDSNALIDNSIFNQINNNMSNFNPDVKNNESGKEICPCCTIL